MRTLAKSRGRLPRHALVVDDGRVGCPLVGGDVDLDACFACGRLAGVSEGQPGRADYVVCREVARVV